MTPNRASARTVLTRLHPDLDHPPPAVLLMIIVTALVVTLGARYAAPDATAATTDQTFETDHHVVTLAQDGTLTIVDKKTRTAVQDTADPGSPAPTEKELAAKTDGLSQQFKKNLGWDLTVEADRTRLINEARALSQQLHNIPQATLDLEKNVGLRMLRGIVDEMDGTKNCRERCLVRGEIETIIVGVGLGVSLRILKSHLARGEPLNVAQAVAGYILISAQFLAFLIMLERDMIDMPEAFKFLIIVIMAKILTDVVATFSDIADHVAHSRMTMRQEVTDAAQYIDSLTPDDEPATDYDLVKDEL